MTVFVFIIMYYVSYIICVYYHVFVGVMRSLTDSFKAIRGSRIDRFVIETNKLLIRLDKLLNSDVNMDPGKRKGLINCALYSTVVIIFFHSFSCICKR